MRASGGAEFALMMNIMMSLRRIAEARRRYDGGQSQCRRNTGRSGIGCTVLGSANAAVDDSVGVCKQQKKMTTRDTDMGHGQKRTRHRIERVLVRFCYVMKNFLQRGSMGGE